MPATSAGMTIQEALPPLLLRSDTFALTALLAVLTTLGPMSIDLYLPSLPDIEHQLQATPAQAELTISAYLVGFAAGQIVYGPVSDRYGRKPVLRRRFRSFS